MTKIVNPSHGSQAIDRFLVLRRELYRLTSWLASRGEPSAGSAFARLDDYERQLARVVARALDDASGIVEVYKHEREHALSNGDLEYWDRRRIETELQKIGAFLVLLENIG